MSKIGTLDFTGISGHVYTFNVYPFKNGHLSNKEAVYIVTKRLVKADSHVEHILSYVGETNDLAKEFASHPKAEEFEKDQANSICVYWEDHDDTRAKIKDDLKNHYHPPRNDFE
jgi:hypothetical protein